MQHIAQRRKAADQVVLLEHEANLGAQGAQPAGIQRAHIAAKQADGARIRLDQAQAAAQQGGLAGPVGADQRHRLAGGHGEIDAFQHLGGGEALGHAGHREVCARRSRSRPWGGLRVHA